MVSEHEQNLEMRHQWLSQFLLLTSQVIRFCQVLLET